MNRDEPPAATVPSKPDAGLPEPHRPLGYPAGWLEADGKLYPPPAPADR